ncbi:adenosylmethionine--8-amino-7-oxononanoate transaminase [Wenzhouxiangella marina]|uniref:Adenosylmethionine-8-amino-7-oxononanoate aminotransferase n=1 Tax=Wenzhouxiangella marina TaxID=1579979 RepID=A0A0K0XTC3_9GAMM|nr:adenosylmethionine--8-amino-7-oxononanoate transaminase [Wenzhouxiangella marina]AKS40938.1 adenosylmethionine-8-amino-7-oxononanoate aminotransferase [Wenzhouxiangella marina]MBB6087812.1 adenosylmethionine-8-amino-7-oxononanoate aminotransferase [Wenzhouxiangella marina]
MSNQHWRERDLAALWHPCSQMKDHEWLPMIPIRRGRGVWLEDYDGHRYLDAISSWWVNLFGHANEHVAARIAEQARELEHVILAGFSHAPAIELAERLTQLAPPGLERVFYADSGSAAVEIALKMSFHYWLNQGQAEKTRFVCLSGSYHGETLGALAVGDVGLYRDTYKPLLLQPLVVPSPDCFEREPGQSWAEFSVERFRDMEKLLAERHSEIAAVIVEPLVQCAGGMRMYHPVYLERLRQACDRYGVHLIADEIAVGFGRTGTLFACEQAGIRPDFMCLSKGLTGGFLPLSAVLTRESIYQAFYHDYEQLKAFMHSHSYTGNALCCTAALATLDLFEASDVLADNRLKSKRMRERVAELEDHPNVHEIRQHGMILAMEMGRSDGQPYPWEERRGIRVYRYGLEHETLLRPLGNVVYFMPPYVINDEEIDQLARVAIEGIHQATRD